MYILNSDQFAPITSIRYSIVNGILMAAYCFRVGGAKIHWFELKEGGILNSFSIFCWLTFISFTFFPAY
jgi:hypothetical protein